MWWLFEYEYLIYMLHVKNIVLLAALASYICNNFARVYATCEMLHVVAIAFYNMLYGQHVVFQTPTKQVIVAKAV